MNKPQKHVKEHIICWLLITWKYINKFYVLIYICIPSCWVVFTLCDPMDCSPPGPTDHGIFQARIPESSSWIYMHSQCISLQGMAYAKFRRVIEYLCSWRRLNLEASIYTGLHFVSNYFFFCQVVDNDFLKYCHLCLHVT